MTATTTVRVSAVVGKTLGGAVDWAGGRLDPVGNASAALEGISFLDSFTPSLMPRTSVHQGMAAGLHVLGARFVGGRLDALQTMVLGAGASAPASLAGRAVAFAAGQAASMIPAAEDETL